jgi:hypothetical protein
MPRDVAQEESPATGMDVISDRCEGLNRNRPTLAIIIIPVVTTFCIKQSPGKATISLHGENVVLTTAGSNCSTLSKEDERDFSPRPI